MKYLAAFTLALSMALIGFSAPAGAHGGSSNDLLWQGCVMGLDSLCPILAMDAAGGEPQAQYMMAMILLYKEGNKRATDAAATLIYESAAKGYAPAVTVWNRIAGKTIERPGKAETEITPTHTDAKYLIALLE